MSRTLRSVALTAALVAASPASCAWIHADSGVPAGPQEPRSSSTDPSAAIVAQVQRADYEADRAALHRLHAQLTPAGDARRASRLLYWRGFALWRSAMNGFNDAVEPAALDADLDGAVREFEAALARDPAFTDATVGLVSSLQLLAFLHRSDDARARAFIARAIPLLRDVQATAPDHPRLLWVVGPSLWYAPPGLTPEEVAARRSRAMSGYERGLRIVRAQKDARADPLEPAWGEPELLMSLAWSNLNQAAPDLEAADRHARAALAIVPHWHYVRDILLPQIQRKMGSG